MREEESVVWSTVLRRLVPVSVRLPVFAQIAA